MSYKQATDIPNLTIWVPTYNRPREVEQLVSQARNLGLTRRYDFIISDNGSEDLFDLDRTGDQQERLIVKQRGCNLSAGANFLRAFEETSTEWVHIMSDDDAFSVNYTEVVDACICQCDESVIAIKFDTGLFGKQIDGRHSTLLSAVSDIGTSEIGDWFNNLLLISGWIFRREEYLRYISKAYLGYGTKLSHILPPLACCDAENKQIFFSAEQPVMFNNANDDGWPRAPSWTEMCLTTQLGYGYLSSYNRRALYHCLFEGKSDRLFAKILRIRAFYDKAQCGIHWTNILLALSSISLRFCVLTTIMMPFLWIPVGLWPKRLVRKLGGIGSVERW